MGTRCVLWGRKIIFKLFKWVWGFTILICFCLCFILLLFCIFQYQAISRKTVKYRKTGCYFVNAENIWRCRMYAKTLLLLDRAVTCPKYKTYRPWAHSRPDHIIDRMLVECVAQPWRNTYVRKMFYNITFANLIL